MSRQIHLHAVLALALAGCNQNTAIGNDREAQLDPAPTPGPIMAADAALRNVELATIKPETMTDAEVQALGSGQHRCIFTLTELGYPTFVYEPGRRGIIKLNGKLIPVDAAGPDDYASGGLLVATRTVDDTGNAGLQVQELIVVPPGARDELGYRGYVSCADGENA